MSCVFDRNEQIESFKFNVVFPPFLFLKDFVVLVFHAMILVFSPIEMQTSVWDLVGFE